MNTRLFFAVYEDDLVLVKKILSETKNLDLDAFDAPPDEGGEVLLSQAIGNWNIDMVELLLRNGADPNIKVWEGSLLHLAIDISVERTKNNDDILEDDISIIKLLVEYGADISIKDDEGKTPYEFAKNYHIPAEKYLAQFEKINKNDE